MQHIIDNHDSLNKDYNENIKKQLDKNEFMEFKVKVLN